MNIVVIENREWVYRNYVYYCNNGVMELRRRRKVTVRARPIGIVFTLLVFVTLAVTGCSHKLDMVDCKELFAEFPVDPEIARQNVPQGYEVLIHKNGKAMMLILVQECEKCVFDSLIPVSPMNMSQVWIEIAGPNEVGPPLPDTTGSLPTRYWYILPHQTDRTLAHISFKIAGIDSQLVKEISQGGKPGGVRQGRVIEKKSPVMYTWTETSKLWPEPKLVTGRQKFYRQYGRFIKRASEGSVTCRANFIGDGEIVLKADPASAVGSLKFGTELHGTTKLVEINCRANVKVSLR